MTKAFVLDGKAIADEVIGKVAAETRALAVRGVTPGLAVVLVGEDPASQSYVAGKGKAAKNCGFHSLQHTLPAETSEADLLALVARLNADPAIHGILVQLPLPGHVRSALVLEAIDPKKDVDGFHPINVGLLSIGEMERALVPCTPAGAMIMLDRACEALGTTLAGKEAVVLGRSNIVGKPMAQLLLSRHCTVTIAHSRTRDLPDVARRADILVAAVGRPEMVRGYWVKPGAIVIDVGINRVAGQGLDADGKPKTRLVGDVAYGGGGGGRRRDHAGSGRRRPDDDRHADGQHARGGEASGRLARDAIGSNRRPSLNRPRPGPTTGRRGRRCRSGSPQDLTANPKPGKRVGRSCFPVFRRARSDSRSADALPDQGSSPCFSLVTGRDSEDPCAFRPASATAVLILECL